MMLLLRYSSDMMFCSVLTFISKPTTILLNTCVNITCNWMKFWVPDVHDLTANVLYYSLLVDCVFFSRLWFGLLWRRTKKLCCCFECPFIVWGRCSIDTVWKNMSRLSRPVARAFSLFTFLWKTCSQLFLCHFLFLLFSLVSFLGIFVFWGLLLCFDCYGIVVPVFLSCMQLISCPLDIDSFSPNIGSPFHLIDCHTFICLNFKLIGTSSIY